ncbi:MAG: hypothetical protein ACI9WU_004662 [Myxococcota bacterium]|jgi:hypothetical protein
MLSADNTVRDEPPVDMMGLVIRTCQRGSSATPGIALKWLGAESEADPIFFGRFLQSLFGEPVSVQRVGLVTMWGLALGVIEAEGLDDPKGDLIDLDDGDAVEVESVDPGFISDMLAESGRRNVVFAPR